MKTFIEGVIALLGVALNITLGFIATIARNPEKATEYKQNHELLLEQVDIPFDLWVIAICMILACAALDKKKKQTDSKDSIKDKLFWPGLSILSIGFLLLGYYGIVYLMEWVDPWVTIGFPDFVGAVCILIAIKAVLAAREVTG